MITRLKSDRNPNFFFLNYDARLMEVINFLVIPKHFFVPEIIEKRKPLALTARRAGWVGCNILLESIPLSGRIFFIKKRIVEPKTKVLSAWKNTSFLRDEKEPTTKGWLMDVMKCIDAFGHHEFSLDEAYAFEEVLSQKHPENRHIKDKIRQKLQVLRDNGYIEFVGRGRYRRT